VRSGNLLLCKKPLNYKNSPLYGNGCNSWKGRFYDTPISEILAGRVQNLRSLNKRIRNPHIIGGLMLGYLAMVAEYGYIITLMSSGRLLREQFFNPARFHRSLDSRYQILLAGAPFKEAKDSIWNKPFSFKFDRGACLVTVRNFVITVPMSRDPFMPSSEHIQIVPSRFKLRPDFSTAFS
jgi:hypothetical protein